MWGRSPTWGQLFPDGDEPVMNGNTAFDLQLLNKFVLDGDVDAIGMWAYHEKPMAAHLVTHDKYPTFLGLIMPMKVDTEHMFVRPLWLD